MPLPASHLDRYARVVGAFLTVWVLCGITCGVLLHVGLGPWLELLNGATWPNQFYGAADQRSEATERGFWFVAVLSFRTTINLGAVLSALVAVVWVAGGGLERFAMSQVQAYARIKAAALVSELLAVLDDANVEISAEVEQRMYQVAKDFDKTSIGVAVEKIAPPESATSN